MKKIESAGIALIRRGSFSTQTLMGHATHKNAASLNDQRWGILKGKVEEGESLWVAAKREFEEESGFKIKEDRFLSFAIDAVGKPAPLISYTLKVNDGGKKVTKTVHVFVLEDTVQLVNSSELKCQTTIKETDYPEIDAYQWIELSGAHRVCMPSQLPVYQHLKEIFPRS